MKSSVSTLFGLLILSTMMPAEALSADAPKRKTGLWEMKTQMSGMPAGMPGGGLVQICIDQAKDDIMQESSREKSNCPVMEVNHSGGKILIHAVCKDDGSTQTIDAVITGDLGKSYKSDMKVTISPPQDGVSQMKIIQEGRWLGACKAGQKPGDVMVPGMPAMNTGDIQQMMNDPKMKELMKQYQNK